MKKVEDVTILKYIDNYFYEYGYAPSYREIMAGVGLSSISSMHYRINKMTENGLLETDHPGVPRAIRITIKGLNLLG